jgi:hypothetical protein
MSQGGRFSGWRYATSNELSTLFKHFIGGPETTTDPSIEDKFQRLLGGPLNVDGNPATGWYRTSSSAIVEDHSALGRELRGYIANDRSTGAIITPKVEGYTIDKYASYGNHRASWLVQQR